MRLRSGRYSCSPHGWDAMGTTVTREASVCDRVLPTRHESWWFHLVVAATIWTAAALICRRRLRRLNLAYEARLDAQLTEHTQLASDRHDTLLQSFQGLMFRLEAVRALLPAEATKATTVLDTALIQGETAIDHARFSGSELRGAEAQDVDLQDVIVAILRETMQGAAFAASATWNVRSVGPVQALARSVRYEVQQVVREAIRNVVRHAGASQIAIEVRYTLARVEVSVADDGIGVSLERRATAAAMGHYGMLRMAERMERLGGQLAVSSKPHEGTQVVLSVPSVVAFAHRTPGSTLGWFRRHLAYWLPHRG